MSTSRRAANADPNQKILGETAKLVGNVGFGRFIMDVGRHQEVKYEQDESKVARAINNFFFHDLEELSNEVFELKVCSRRRSSATCPSRSVSSSSPTPSYACWNSITIASTPFWIGETFMDTDSAYISLAGDSLEELVKPDKSSPPSSTSGFHATTRRSTPPTANANRAFSR